MVNFRDFRSFLGDIDICYDFVIFHLNSRLSSLFLFFFIQTFFIISIIIFANLISYVDGILLFVHGIRYA